VDANSSPSLLIIPEGRSLGLTRQFSSSSIHNNNNKYISGQTGSMVSFSPEDRSRATNLLVVSTREPTKRAFHPSSKTLKDAAVEEKDAADDEEDEEDKAKKLEKRKKLKKKKKKLLKEKELDQETLMKMAAEPKSLALPGSSLAEALKKEGVEVLKLGEGAEGAFVRLKDALKCLELLERRRFLIEFVDIWPDQDSALYTDALHSIEMGTLYLKHSEEALITECIAKARRQLTKILDIKDPSKRGEFVSFGLIEKGAWFPPEETQL